MKFEVIEQKIKCENGVNSLDENVIAIFEKLTDARDYCLFRTKNFSFFVREKNET